MKALSQLFHQKWQGIAVLLANVARFILAVTLVFSGAVKLNDPIGTVDKLQEYLTAWNLPIPHDIVVLAAGQPEQFGKEYFREGQIVADVGISWSEAKQKITGDVKFDEVEPIVSMITPVPGGVGSVTTSVLVTNVITAAKRAAGIE